MNQHLVGHQQCKKARDIWGKRHLLQPGWWNVSNGKLTLPKSDGIIWDSSHLSWKGQCMAMFPKTWCHLGTFALAMLSFRHVFSCQLRRAGRFLNRLAKLWLGLSCVPIPISGSSSISGNGILYILFYKPKTKEQKLRKKKNIYKQMLNLHVKRWLLYYLHIPAYNLELPQGPQLVIIFLARPMDEPHRNWVRNKQKQGFWPFM